MLTIKPIEEHESNAVLDVYRACEDFLALGPEPRASMEMVRKDMQLSEEEGGVFCGVYSDEEMIGVLDFVPGGFGSDPHAAFISLLMIVQPFRSRGLGTEVVGLAEREIMRNAQVRCIRSAVQVNNPTAVRFWQRQGYNIVGGPELQTDGTTVFHLHKVVQQ